MLSPVFETALAELLLGELRRQGVSQSNESVDAIMQRVKVDRGNDDTKASATATFALGGLGLGDREGIAVAESLLKLASPSMLKIHGVGCWMLAINDNALTDRSAAHLSLLASRCAPPLVSIDARGNAMTPSAIHRIEEAGAMSPSLRVILLTSEVTAKTTGKSLRAGSLSAASAGSRGPASRRGVDMEALQKRRCTLFVKAAGGMEVEGRTSVAAPVRCVTESSKNPPRANEREVTANKASNTFSVVASKRGDSQRSKALKALTRQDITVDKRPAEAGKRFGSITTKKVQAQRDTARSNSQSDKDAPPAVEESLDVTANLNPALMSVLDLSNMVPSGQLNKLYGTNDIWGVIGAHSGSSSRLHSNDSGLDPSKAVEFGITLQSLTVLSIPNNGLTSLEVLPSSLLRLDVSGNELCVLSGLDKCKMLTLLNARHNRLESMMGLERNVALSHLFLGHNDISFVEGIAHLLVLETLDLAHNKLKTQASIRPLSLSKGLRHVILRGNPVMERMKQPCRPLLRNLCPSLVSIDGDPLTFSRLAEKAQRESGYRHLPYAMEGENNVGNALEGAWGGVTTDATNCANYVHLLTRGTTVGDITGYSGAARARHMAKTLQARAVAAEEAKTRQRRKPSGQGGGETLRHVLLKRLAQESKKFLESVLEERLSNLHASCVGNTAPVSCDGNQKAGGTIDDEGRKSNSPLHGLESVREGGLTNSSESVEENSHTVSERTQCTTFSGVDNEGKGAGLKLLQDVQHSSAVHRDTTLNHEEWMRLREGQGVRRAPLGETPRRLSLRAATPHDDHRRWRDNALRVSPIRRHVDESNMISANDTEILRDMDMLASPTAVKGVASLEPKAKPCVMEKNLRRRMLLSPSTNCLPVKAYEIRPSPRSVRRSRPMTSPSPPPLRSTKAQQKNLLFSPPPPLTSPCTVDVNTKGDFVNAWVMQLNADAEAVQDALHAIVSLLGTQRRCLTTSGANSFSLPTVCLEERRRCVDILKESGMLLDTEVPLSVVKYYHFTQDELNCTGEEENFWEDDDRFVLCNAVTDSGKHYKKGEVLRCIRLLGDGKTCLRYLVLLMEERRERELQQYVDELLEFMSCE